MDIDIKDIYSHNRKIIDIRQSYQYMNGHIPNSSNVLENKLLLTPQLYLKKDEEYILYCDYGYRSKKVCNYLLQQGYKVYTLIGGYNSYLQNS